MGQGASNTAINRGVKLWVCPDTLNSSLYRLSKRAFIFSQETGTQPFSQETGTQPFSPCMTRSQPDRVCAIFSQAANPPACAPRKDTAHTLLGFFGT